MMKKVFLLILLFFQFFGNSLLYSFVLRDRGNFSDKKNCVNKFFDVIVGVVDLSGLGDIIKDRCVEDKHEEPINFDNKGVYLVLTLNQISSISLIFLQCVIVFLGFIGLVRAKGRGLGGRWYTYMFLFILFFGIYKYVYYAPRSSVSDCVVCLVGGVLISFHYNCGMKLGSHLKLDSRCVDVRICRCEDL